MADFAKAHIGESGFTASVCSIFIVGASLFFIYIIKDRYNPAKALASIAVLAIGLIVVWQIEVVIERIHILEFAVLGWFAARDLSKADKKRGIILASLFCSAIGILDEIFQWILPYRYFQLQDIAFNTLGGMWGAILYSLR